MRTKQIIGKTPVIGKLLKKVYRRLHGRGTEQFPGSAPYWESRYQSGGNSGVGSYGRFAAFKADVINRFIIDRNVNRVIEFGCGDGHQLTLAKYPSYLGFDVSASVISRCKEVFASDPNKCFRLMAEYGGEKGDLTLSLDVVYHLVEDSVFEQYMRTLYDASEQYVIIYSSDSDQNSENGGNHVRHRKFTRWVQQNLPHWSLVQHIPNRYPYHGDCDKGSFAEFFIYETNPIRSEQNAEG